MKTLLSFLVLLMCLSGVQSSAQLTQSEPAVIKPGNSHTMTCTASGFNFAGYWMSWVRQTPNGPLQWLCEISPDSGTKNYLDSIKGRFTISRDNSNNVLNLKMDNMKTEDTALYYCARRASGGPSWAFDIWGPGTTLTVTSAEPKGPSLFPLISCGTSQEKSTTVGCLAKDFLPGSIDFSWVDQLSNNYTFGLKKYNSVLQTGGTYAASSQIKVPTEGWENNDSYYCTAKHLDKTESVVLQFPRVIGRKPTVTIHPPIKDDVDSTSNATIVCIASGFYPKNIQVSWKKNTEVIRDAVTEEAVSGANGSFMITSYIVVSKHDWDTDATFSCIVKHDPSDFLEMKNVSKATVCEPNTPGGQIKVAAVPPSFETIYFQNTAPLTCIITNMENKDGLEVTWYANDEKLTNTQLDDPVYDSSIRRYTAKAIATVCPEDWRTKTFKCSVSHPDLPGVQVALLKKPNGQDAKPPTVMLYSPHPDELAKKETATLICHIRGFAPDDIFVKWMDSDNVELSHAATTGPIQEITSSSKKTYFLVSTLTVPSVQDWNSGKSYTCIVGHESLPLHTTQRTTDKTAGKPNHVNVSLVMSDSC